LYSISCGGWGSTVSSPSRVPGRALAEIKFDEFGLEICNNFNDFAKNQLSKFCAVSTQFAIMIMMPIGYPE